MADLMTKEEPATIATTYGWLSSLPLAATAGNAVYSIYEGSKRYNCVTQYAIQSVESSVKLAASAVSPVVKRLDKPLHAIDSFAVGKLVQLEEKVPAVKTEPEQIVAYISETKEALANKIIESHAAISTRITEGKAHLTNQLASGKDVVCSKFSAGTEAVVQSRAGTAISDGKNVLVSQLAQGKETIKNSIACGRDAVYSKVQCGTEYVASTKAGCLVGSGVDCTLSATENLVDYLLPQIENENELAEYEIKEDKNSESCIESSAGRMDKMYTLSQRAKLRMYFYAMQKLQSMQQNCQSTLQHLKQTVDLLKLAQATRDGIDKQYHNVTSALKDLEEQIKQLLSRHSSTNWLPDSDEEDDNEVKADWLTPKSQGIVQSPLDYAKRLSEKVFHTFKSVTVVTAYLPSHLRGGANQGYQYAQEMYSTLKPVQSPADLKVSVLNRMSSLLETQLGYVSQLGAYLSTVLQRPTDSFPKEQDDSEDDEDDDGNGDEPVNN